MYPGRRPGDPGLYDPVAKRPRSLVGYAAGIQGMGVPEGAPSGYMLDQLSMGAYGGGVPGYPGGSGIAGAYDIRGLGLAGIIGAPGGGVGAGMGLLGVSGSTGSRGPVVAISHVRGGAVLEGGPKPLPVVKCRGLPYSCEESDVVEFFAGLDVLDVVLVRREGRLTGEALVLFPSMVQADLALQRNRMNMGRRYIEIFRSKRADYYNTVANEVAQDGGTYKEPGGESSRAQPGGTAPGTAPVPANDLAAPRSPPGVTAPPGAGASPRSTDSRSSVLKLRGLPYSATRQDVVDFFSGYDLSDSRVHLLTNSDGRNTGEGFVEFETPDQAAAAMSKDRGRIGIRYVELFQCSQDEAARGIARASK